jgi:hypothetical protein
MSGKTNLTKPTALAASAWCKMAEEFRCRPGLISTEDSGPILMGPRNRVAGASTRAVANGIPSTIVNIGKLA